MNWKSYSKTPKHGSLTDCVVTSRNALQTLMEEWIMVPYMYRISKRYAYYRVPTCSYLIQTHAHN